MRWNDYQKQIRRRRRPMKQEEKVDYDDMVTNEYEDYEIIENIDKDNIHEEDNQHQGFYSMNNKQNSDDYIEDDKYANSKFHSFNKKHTNHNQNYKGGYKESFEGGNKHNNQEFQGFHSFKKENKGYEEKEFKGFKGFSNQEDTQATPDPLKTIEKLFKGDNQMVKEIIETIGDTGILENFKEPLGIIERVYGPLLDGNANQQRRPPMWAYNKANRRIKHMQRQNANKQLHSEMYSMILKQVKDLLVNNYGGKIKNNMPMLFDEDDE